MVIIIGGLRSDQGPETVLKTVVEARLALSLDSEGVIIRSAHHVFVQTSLGMGRFTIEEWEAAKKHDRTRY